MSAALVAGPNSVVSCPSDPGNGDGETGKLWVLRYIWSCRTSSPVILRVRFLMKWYFGGRGESGGVGRKAVQRFPVRGENSWSLRQVTIAGVEVPPPPPPPLVRRVTSQEKVAGDASVLSEVSIALTEKVCVPGERVGVVYGEVQEVKDEESREHSKVPSSFEVKVKMPMELVVEEMERVVEGGVVSGIIPAVGVVVAILEALPVPTLLIADTRKSYPESFVRPVTVAVVVVPVPSLNVVQLESAESLYSTI